MLRSLHIKNYILIDSLDIVFPEGLVIITGQTGAGKSILLGALSLVTGAKADPSVISDGAESCVVEAEFGPSENVREIVEDGGADWDEGGLIIRRVINRNGRSRCFVNDSPVQIQTLAGLAAKLVDIHSQHRSLLLTDKAFQLEILDHFAGNDADRARCAELWRKLQAGRRELEDLKRKLAGLNAENDWNESQYRQLEAAGLREGELEELESEQKCLANAEEIKEALGAAGAIFNPEDGNGTCASLREARRQVAHAAKFIPGLTEIAERLESCRIEIEDISDEIESRNASVELDSGRLEEVEERMSVLYGLMRKHSCGSVKELIEVRDRLGESLFDADALNDRISALEAGNGKLARAHEEICGRLHESRAAAAGKFSEEITESLHFLELDRSIFMADTECCEPGVTGADSVLFRFSSTGSSAVDVAKCASGGELSRIMLCLKKMMARFAGMPTMVFDEIDTGVSGSVADKMGSMICAMGEGMQVFSITHLPQVAAKGKAHYVVCKSVKDDGKTVSSIKKVEGRERTLEIARLLSGASVTDAAIANAESLLQGR